MDADLHHRHRHCTAWLWVIPCLAFIVASVVAQWGRLRVGFDSYYYIEFAKAFRTDFPSSFGEAWPFGWPLLGALTGLIGLTAYQGLLALAVLCWILLTFIASKHWPWENTGITGGLLVLATTASLFHVTALVAGVFSEIPFSLLTLCFGLSLSRWPNPHAILTSALFALAAFGIRYSGAILLLLLGIWPLIKYRALIQSHQLIKALITVALTAACSFLLLYSNYHTTGYWSGHGSRSNVPISEWLKIASDLGWSFPTLIGGLGVRGILGYGSAGQIAWGLILLSIIVSLGIFALRSHGSKLRQSLGAVIIGYALGLIVLRCIGTFDTLDSARMILPLLFPMLLVFPYSRLPRKMGYTALVAILIFNAFRCWRGASLELGADVKPALAVLNDIDAKEFVSANDHARTLSALLEAPVRRISSPQLSHHPDYGQFVVLAGAPHTRIDDGALSDKWTHWANHLIISKQYEYLLETNQLIVMRRITPSL